MFSYIAGPCRFCVHCRFATYARVVGLCSFRMHCGIYRICAYCAPLPCLRATWGFASFTCAVGFCFTRACFGISPLSHVPWGLCRTRACFRFRLFRMCRGPLPHSCLFLGSPLSRVPLAFAAPCLLWDFAAFACTTAFAAPVPAVEFCHIRVHRGLMPRPRSLGGIARSMLAC